MSLLNWNFENSLNFLFESNKVEGKFEEFNFTEIPDELSEWTLDLDLNHDLPEANDILLEMMDRSRKAFTKTSNSRVHSARAKESKSDFSLKDELSD